MEEKKLKVAIVYHCPVLKIALKSLIDKNDIFIIEREVGKEIELLETFKNEGYDLIFLDLGIFSKHGIDIENFITHQCFDTKVITFAHGFEIKYINSAFNAGAYGFILKDNIENEFEPAIENILDRKHFISDEILNIIKIFNKNKTIYNITDRQIRIAWLDKTGKRNSEIAGELLVSEKTVENDKTLFIKAMNAKNMKEAIYIAEEKKII